MIAQRCHAFGLGLLFTLASTVTQARDASWERYKPTKEERSAIAGISAASLEGNLAFLASDFLQGRGTPSRELDIAAQYIASQFHKAGLEPAGDDGYFQTADWAPRSGQKPDGAPAKVRNVIGVLRGSDAALRDTYILVSAHYDHLGVKADGEGDRVFNGANDNGSGTVTVIELATALGRLKMKPKRSIVFMTFYGEERGLVGAYHYSEHPIVPIEKTVAAINFEQVGRTDDGENPGKGLASVTGMDFSEVGRVIELAGKSQGFRIFKHERNSDSFFLRSDNYPLALRGIPAHTVSSAYLFPDYHKVSDEIGLIDFENMAGINRSIAMALLMMGNAKEAPQWNATNPKTAKFVEARKR
jgi:hypothetical protein